MTRRVILLDIDGVLAPIRRGERYGYLDPARIWVLNEPVAGADADVAVSSTWRHRETVAELPVMLDAAGFVGCVIDNTRAGTAGAPRRDEITAWLAEHAVDVYAIVDDHIDPGALRSRLVLTLPARGLQPDDAARASPCSPGRTG